MTGEKDAPAEMPGVEEIARLVAGVMNRDNHALALHTARQIADLFAPILAEKDLHHATGERITRKDLNNAHRKGAEEGRLAAHLIDGVNSPLNACCYRDGCRALEARALAAEAALARLTAELARVEGLRGQALADFGKVSHDAIDNLARAEAAEARALAAEAALAAERERKK